ncbi:MAG: hypothetical protein PVJ77_07990, partial [Desulfobacterales bacterium]
IEVEQRVSFLYFGFPFFSSVFNWGAPVVNDLVPPSYLTDLLKRTVICIGLASYPKSSQPSQF